MEEFLEAVRRGDVTAAARALITDPEVAQRIGDAEARIAAVGRAAFVPSSERFRLQDLFLEDSPQRAWFYAGSDNALCSALISAEADVIAWLYGPQPASAPDLTNSLAFLFYSILFQAIHRNRVAVLELLLSSATFLKVFTDRERQIVLEDAMVRIGGENAEATISLLVAHGATFTSEDGDALPVFGSRVRASVRLLRHIAAEGARFVGLQRVLHRMAVDAETLRELVRLGIDVRDDAVVDLRGTASAGAADQLEIIGALLEDGLVDVDAQDDQGRFSDSGTALMRAVRGLFGLREDGTDDTPVLVALLLRYGADPGLPDRRGLTAIDYLTMSADEARFKTLGYILLNTA